MLLMARILGVRDTTLNLQQSRTPRGYKPHCGLRWAEVGCVVEYVSRGATSGDPARVYISICRCFLVWF